MHISYRLTAISTAKRVISGPVQATAIGKCYVTDDNRPDIFTSDRSTSVSKAVYDNRDCENGDYEA
jgi:hypothetical protein